MISGNVSLNSYKSVSLSPEHDHLDESPLSINSYNNTRSLQRGEKIIWELIFLLKYAYTQVILK